MGQGISTRINSRVRLRASATVRQLLALAILLPALLAGAAAQAAPEHLQQWQDWVLEQQPDSRCPWQLGSAGERVCLWPGRLDLALTSSGLTFDFYVDVFSREALVPLPGDSKLWPTAVTLGGRAAPVVEQDGAPFVALPRGAHQLQGELRWTQKPAALTVPSAIALVSLSDAGRRQTIDRRGDQLLFSRADGAATSVAQDSLRVDVYRLLEDGVPPLLRTRVQLVVSGKPREITLGRANWAGTELMALHSQLPARLEQDGNIRLQVVAGTHTIELLARFNSDITTLATQARTAHWPTTEYLSFAAAPALRQVKLEGADSVDTSQLDMPGAWAGYPTYRLAAATRLSLTTVFRGDHAPQANQLNVERDLWLDFDGGGITAQEQVNGMLYRDWRLNAQPDTQLGRATVAAEPVLITTDNGRQGIEIRSPAIALQAVSRIATPDQFSASGWDARADSFTATLHLPPGWRVLHASGVDRIYGTWLSQWNLWSIFLLLIMVVATRKLLGIKTAALAAVAVIISYHEDNAPVLLLPLLLLAIALLGVVTGRWRKGIGAGATVVSALLVIALLGFAIDNFRLALYPSLERYQVDRYHTQSYDSAAGGKLEEITVTASRMESMASNAVSAERARMAQAGMAPAAQRPPEDLYELDDNDRVQTGPGLPTWLWRSIRLEASGPLAAGRQLHLFYSAPGLTSLWRIACVLLLGGYAALLIRRLAAQLRTPPTAAPSTSTPSAPSTPAGLNTAAALLVALTVLLPLTPAPAQAQTAAASFPPQYLLDELRQRLLQAPACLPACVALDNGHLQADAGGLRLRFDASVAADLALPLPQSREGWQISTVQVDGRPAPTVSDGERTLLHLSAGQHRVELAGPVVGDQASIALPLPVHNFSANTPAWLLEGLVDGRVPGQTLTLHTRIKTTQERQDTLIADPIVPLVRVERRFTLGKHWQLTTTVRRVAPEQGPLAVNVALLPMEQVLTDALTLRDGSARLQFSASQQSIGWSSSLTPGAALNLTASSDPNILETWQFAPSSLWHLTYSGLPPVKAATDASALQPLFQPWPGETLQVGISRPAGVAGTTYTVEEAVLEFSAGAQIQKSTLRLDIRSSLGSDYVLPLPAGAEVTALSLDGNSLNLPADATLTVPLHPGLQRLEVSFQETRAAGLRNATPPLQLPGSATNITVQYQLPHDRWLLFFNGPAIGPAMLYWGVLGVILLGALALSRLARHLALPMPIALGGWLLLGLGLSTVNRYGALVVAVFFFALAWRQQRLQPAQLSRRRFNGLQLGLGLLTLLTVFTTVGAIPAGLLASPDMQVVGNGSYAYNYHFYQDRSASGAFPTVQVLSVPMLVYRLVMLLWSLWLATRLIQWAQWWWQAFSAGGVWISPPPKPAATTVDNESRGE